jgi:hypothetical protein
MQGAAMADVPTWEVDLYVDGPVSLPVPYSSRHEPQFILNGPFYSDIDIFGIDSGFQATVVACAPDERLAHEAAVVFFGRMLDALALTVDRPMYLSLTERGQTRKGRVQQDIRRIIKLQEIADAFEEVGQLAKISRTPMSGGPTTPTFLRSLGWYRKGLYTEDPFDKFLAFWNAIAIVASRHFRDIAGINQARAQKGVKNQVWACFQALWGSCDQWPLIPSQEKWIDDSYKIRNDVAHGAGCVDIQRVASVAGRIDLIRQVARKFLQDGRRKFLEYRPSSSEGLQKKATLIALVGSSRTDFPICARRTLIGRQPDAGVSLEASQVSRRHAEIVCEDGAYFIEDKGSTNGTFINGKKVDFRTPLTMRDVLMIGPYRFALRPEKLQPEASRPIAQPKKDVQVTDTTILQQEPVPDRDQITGL